MKKLCYALLLAVMLVAMLINMVERRQVETQRDQLSDLVRIACDRDSTFTDEVEDYCQYTELTTDDLHKWGYCY